MIQVYDGAGEEPLLLSTEAREKLERLFTATNYTSICINARAILNGEVDRAGIKMLMVGYMDESLWPQEPTRQQRYEAACFVDALGDLL